MSISLCASGYRVRVRRRYAWGAALAAVLVLPACSTGASTSGPTPAASTPAGSTPAPSTPAPLTSDPPTTGAPTTSAPPTSAPAPTTTTAAPPVQLPLGGTKILGHYRVVAYYGGPDGPALGVLGTAPPEQMVETIRKRAEKFTPYGLPVQPAMELITTVAQASPGPDGLYSAPIPLQTVRHYLDVARANKMLLILDFQPGRGEFLPQVKQFASVLTDPHVGVALDPEWKMGPGQVPAQVIGSARASSINAVGAYLSRLVTSHKLPDKLLMVHQFRLAMLPDRDRIAHYPGIELILHADGFGTQAAKLNTWNALAFPGRPDGAGFKLFLRQDTNMMTPDEVMALRPRPDVVTYQ